MRNRVTVWRLLNSPFTIWFLSSVVLTSLSWGYSKWKTNEETKKENQEYIAKLDYEIYNRIQYVELTYIALLNNDSNDEAKKMIINNFINSPSTSWILYYGFKERNFKSLLIELHEKVSDTEKAPLKKAISLFDNLVVDFEMKDKNFDFCKFLKIVNQIKESRWDDLLNSKKHLDQDLNNALEKLKKGD
jgi:hypothetical protein